MYAKVSVNKLCRLFGKTRHAFYDKNWYLTEVSRAEYLVLEMVSEIRREIPQIGTRKLYFMLESAFHTHNIKMGRDTLHALLQENGLIVKNQRKYVKTTNSNHWMKKYPNLIKEFVPISPEQLWVADITYIIVADGFNFLNLITDAYSKRIMGYCLHPTLESRGSLNALEMALENRLNKEMKLIHHSDRGSQYCCSEYVLKLKELSVQISMTQKGDPYENAIAERVNGILKQDFMLKREFFDRETALAVVDRSIKSYNELRPHMSCNYLTPMQAHQENGVLKKKWKPKKYIK